MCTSELINDFRKIGVWVRRKVVGHSPRKFRGINVLVDQLC
jgi:hypothetical protein